MLQRGEGSQDDARSSKGEEKRAQPDRATVSHMTEQLGGGLRPLEMGCELRCTSADAIGKGKQ